MQQLIQITTALSAQFIQQSVQLELLFRISKHVLPVLLVNIAGLTAPTQMTAHKVIVLIQKDISADQVVLLQGL